MSGRLAAYAVAAIAGATAAAFLVAAAYMSLAAALGAPSAAAVTAGGLLLIAVASYFAARRPQTRKAASQPESSPLGAEPVSLARALIRQQPLASLALSAAAGFVAGERPKEAAAIARDLARMFTTQREGEQPRV